MNLDDYKDKLELYVAGVLPESEMIAITTEINKNAEIKAEVVQIENAFMAYSSLHAPEISPILKNNILSIGKEPSVPINTKINNRTKLICALGWLLCLTSIAYNIYQYQQRKREQENLEMVQDEQKVFAETYNDLNDKYELTKSQFAEIRQPDTKTIILDNVGKVANAEAVVFWNEESQNVYVDIASLPAPPAGKVYQLWRMTSLDPLTPDNAGVLAGYSENDQKLFVGKKIEKALAFAITLEPEGGSETPTLEELYVLGKV